MNKAEMIEAMKSKVMDKEDKKDMSKDMKLVALKKKLKK